jgi:polyisoprenyl-phosphate glycosyltransferase
VNREPKQRSSDARPAAHDPGAKPLQLVSIVVPAYNEEAVIIAFNQRLTAVRNALAVPSEVIFVNDGSRDATLTLLHEIRGEDPTIAIVDLSRNFGKEIALTAGLDYTHGDAIVVIDADLQDPPELIPRMLELWRGPGVDIVYGQRASRAGETALKKLTSHVFYRVLNMFAEQLIPVDTGDFRVLSRRAVDALGSVRERHRFMKGLFAWIGYSQIAMRYERDPRFAGASKWSYWRLWNLSLEGITSFTIVPLKISTYLGLSVAAFALLYGFYILGRTIIEGNPVPGYPSLLVVMLFLGGVQLMFLGVIGEYLGRMFNEIKQRPLYLLRGGHPATLSDDTPRSDATREAERPTDSRGSGGA